MKTLQTLQNTIKNDIKINTQTRTNRNDQKLTFSFVHSECVFLAAEGFAVCWVRGFGCWEIRSAAKHGGKVRYKKTQKLVFYLDAKYASDSVEFNRQSLSRL
ncbi:hypothetical protein HK14_00675 [Acetobacter cibinongensis]|uniref:Uncharacterized protein n=1 Tax=Acetobacter cibinongensis TaxID=146475 RepID=A0A1Z5YZ98_9PROT|nr:hypothetical protein HK14_00675 [Acetobacter cibinongensis]